MSAVECSARECHLEAIDGGSVCERHGGLAPQVRRAAEVAVAERTMAAYAKPLRPTDSRRNPATALWVEYERTQARLAWLDERVAELTEEEATFGFTKHETAGGFEGGSNTTFEERISPWLTLQARERKHLIEVEKVLASKKFTEAEAAIRDLAVGVVMGLTRDLVLAMERKPEHPKTRARVAEVFAEHEPRALLALDEALALDVLDAEVLP